MKHFTEIEKREEYVVLGLIRKDITDDGELVIYTYSDKCVHEGCWNNITTNSRGHIFNTKTGECVASPMPKFFNLNENEQNLFHNINWNQPYDVFSKEDGWLGVLYRHEGKFKVASRGSFHSSGALWATDFIQGKDLSFLPDEATICFEIINPAQKIILDYKEKETLVVLAAFNRHTKEEYPRHLVEEWASRADLPIVKKIDINIDECLSLQKKEKHIEGFVIRFSDGKRVKVKTEWYLKIAKVMAQMSLISVWETMLNGKVKDEYLKNLPDEVLTIAKTYKADLEKQYQKVENWTKNKCLPIIKKYNNDKKSIALSEERKKLKGTLAHDNIFAFTNSMETHKIDKSIMNSIYPKGNVLANIDFAKED